MKLSPHFTFEELTFSQIAERNSFNNEPQDPEIIGNLKYLAGRLEEVRDVLNYPMLISSGYRSPAVNRVLGSKPTSFHTRGLAADFHCPGFGNPYEIVSTLHGSDIQYDQLICEYDRWVHIGFVPEGEKPRRQTLIIDRSGTRPWE